DLTKITSYNTTPEKVQDHPLEKHKCTKPPTKNVLYIAIET
ncbi:8804_t:CDS:1, partial [Gigaspora rosea]